MELMEIEEVQEAPKAELAPVERAALALESTKTEQHLLALATKHASITVVKDKAGREQAHGAYMEVMRARTAVEKAAKEAREDATKFSKAVIAEAARLTAIVEPEESRLKAARDVWDEEQARIKAEAEAKERARVLAITERIAAIKNYVVLANNCRTSERVAELQVKLCDTEMTGFEEFEAEAVMALADTEAHLNRVLANIREQEYEAARIKAEQEAEAARLKAEREELDRQRAEAAAQAKAQADADRAELDRQRKEMDEQRAAAQAEAQRVADEARALADAAEAKVRAAAEAMAAERAELDRQQAEAAAAIKKQQDELAAQRAEAAAYAQRVADEARAQAEAAEAKVRAAAEAMALERAEFERQKAEQEAKAKPVEQEAANDFHRDAEPDLIQHTSPMFRGLAPEPFTTSEERDAVALIVKDVPAPAPVASAIVLAVAEFWHTDNKTAARWITERADEIATLKG